MLFRYPDKPTEAGLSALTTFQQKSEWYAQYKYDGYRVGIYFDKGSVELYSRAANPLSKATKIPNNLHSQFLELQKHFKFNITDSIKDGTVLDGEFVGPRGKHDACIYLFDTLAINGKWLNQTDFQDRWKFIQLLEPYLSNLNLIKLAHTIDTNFLETFNQLKNEWIQGGQDLSLCEGLVLKRKTGKLILKNTSCAVSQDSFKVKYRDIREKRW